MDIDAIKNKKIPAGMQNPDETSLAGLLLVASPYLKSPEFKQSVILLCAHNEEGAIGLKINEPLTDMTLTEMLLQLKIPTNMHLLHDHPVLSGGPLSDQRGFVLSVCEADNDNALGVPGGFELTTDINMLKRIAQGKGPKDYLIALGYAAWDKGQLEQEIFQDSWLIVPADNSLLFAEDHNETWAKALEKVGIKDAIFYSASHGHC